VTTNELRSEKAEKLLPANLIPPEFAAIGKKRLEDLAAMQKELLEKLQQMNLSWLDRMQSEATLASEFSSELTTARSIPETATVYQKWATRRMEMAAEDTKRLLVDGQNFIETGARLLSTGWLPMAAGAFTRQGGNPWSATTSKS
jgi:hypothetical protein